ncbi:MAG: VWA domain-containing protein [Planctomycetes bacterium]|nr:VWA domain-containing protein [Planctomycetota bacterium]
MPATTSRALRAGALWLASFLSSSAAAQGLFHGDFERALRQESIVLESEAVELTWREGLAVTEVRQRLANRTRREAEHELLFPLPEGAAISGFELRVNGTVLPGEVLGAGEARAIYERIVRTRRDPGLLEWVGRGLLRARVFPVPALGRVEVSFRYSQVLPVIGDFRAYSFPLSGRFHGSHAPQSWSLQVKLEVNGGVVALHSPTHEIAVQRRSPERVEASVEVGGDLLERDLLLYASERRTELDFALLAHRPSTGEGTVALFFTPGESRSSADRPKDVVCVLDISGSMAGEKLAQAKTALAACVAALRPIDRFALIAFHGEVIPVTAGLRPAIEDEKERARRSLSALRAAGATNLCGGLEAALALAEQGVERSFHLMLLSDGLPTVGAKEPREILARAALAQRRSVRCFVFGVGDDVDTLLLDRLAEESRGTRQYLRPGEDLNLAVSRIAERIAEPVLSDLELSVVGAELSGLMPARLPDLFRGSTLAVFGRTSGSGPIVVRLRGRGGRGAQEFAWAAELPACEERGAELAAQWASKRIGVLLDEMRWSGPHAELRQEIERLGREHGLVTPFTSLLALEERDRLALSRGVRAERRSRPATEGDEFTLGTVRAPATPSHPRSPQIPAGPATPAGPMSGSGAAAVERSLRSKALREGAIGERLGEGELGRELRSVAGRRFFLVGGVWIEEGFRTEERAQVQRLEFGSAEYFAHLCRDELAARFAALGTRVLFRSGDGYVEIVDGGG